MKEYLGGALVQVGLCKAPNPILSIRMNARFAFLEMRTAEDATAALNLDGIPFGGAALSVGRPKKVRERTRVSLVNTNVHLRRMPKRYYSQYQREVHRCLFAHCSM